MPIWHGKRWLAMLQRHTWAGRYVVHRHGKAGSAARVRYQGSGAAACTAVATAVAPGILAFKPVAADGIRIGMLVVCADWEGGPAVVRALTSG